jgi:glutamate carboxypeptidase
MDTVFPLGTIQKMPFHEKDGKIYGPGTSDMKGGIVVGLSALATWGKTGRKLPHRHSAAARAEHTAHPHLPRE